MRFDRKQQFVSKVRTKARRRGCQKCHKIKEVGICGDESLNQMLRRGADVQTLKTAIRDRGWFCRACVRKKKGTVAAATLKDQYDMRDPAQKLTYEVLVNNMEPYRSKMLALGYVMSEDKTDWVLPPTPDSIV